MLLKVSFSAEDCGEIRLNFMTHYSPRFSDRTYYSQGFVQGTQSVYFALNSEELLGFLELVFRCSQPIIELHSVEARLEMESRSRAR